MRFRHINFIVLVLISVISICSCGQKQIQIENQNIQQREDNIFQQRNSQKVAIAYASPIFLRVNENNREINPSHQMSNEFFTGVLEGKGFRTNILEVDEDLETELELSDVLIIFWRLEPFRKSHIDKIVSFVQQGGGLLILGEDQVFSNPNGAINQVAERFNVKFNNDTIIDPENMVNMVLPDPYKRVVKVPKSIEHPITEGVESWVSWGSCSLQIEKNAHAKAPFRGDSSSYSSKLSLRSSKNPIAIAILNEGKGRVALVGDSGWLMFPSWQIRKNVDNEKIAINLVDWLAGNITGEGEDAVYEITKPISPKNDKILRTKIDKIVEKIEKVNIVMDSAVGVAGERPEQYDNFISLKNNATKEELIELTNHSNPTVRCYAFWALSYDKTVDPFPIILDHLDDEEYVRTFSGCIMMDEKVGDYFVSILYDNDDLSPEQLKKLDNILIDTPNNLTAKDAAIDRAKLTEDLYPKLRDLFINEDNQTALAKLAKYQKEQDVELILNNSEYGKLGEVSNSYYTYLAITNYPHPSFMPLLEKDLKETFDKTHFSNEWSQLYRAIACYQNDKALELLSMPLTQIKHDNIREFHIRFLFGALEEFKKPIYNDLIWKLWEEEDMITLDVFEYLYESNPEKVFELTKKSLQESTNANSSLINRMLDLTLGKDRDFALSTIGKNIKEANVHIFPIFAEKAIEIKDDSFIEPLFERFGGESNPHIYLAIAQALIAYNDKEINKRILEVKEKNESMRSGWGAESLESILGEMRPE